MSPLTPFRRRTALLALVAMLAVGSAQAADAGKTVSETRVVSGFQAILLRSSIKVTLRQGGHEGIELHGDANVLPLIETRVVDRDGVPTLEIGARRGASFSTRSDLSATVDLVTLQALSISGASDVTADALKTTALQVAISGSGNVRIGQLTADQVALKISGSGDIRFGGRAPRLDVAISGSGDVDTRGLEADEVAIRVAGSGAAQVVARKTLTVSIAGVGSVKYSGDPVVKSSISGHGEVTRQ